MEDFRQKKFFKLADLEEDIPSIRIQVNGTVKKYKPNWMRNCIPGELYFTDQENILYYIKRSLSLIEVILPFDDPELQIVRENDKWRTNKFILGKRYDLLDVGTIEYLASLGVDIDQWKYFLLNLYKCSRSHCWCIEINPEIYNNEKYRQLVVYIYDNYNNNNSVGVWLCRSENLDIIKHLHSLGKTISWDEIVIKSVISNRDLELLQYFVSIGMNISAYDNCALKYASELGNLNTVKYLIQMGADINQCQDILVGNSCSSGNTDLVKYFISLGMDVNNGAFANACANGHLGLVKYLCQLGVDIGKDNNRAAKMAAKNKHLDVFKYLVDEGARLE